MSRCEVCGETAPEPAWYCLFRGMRLRGELPAAQGCDYSREGDERLGLKLDRELRCVHFVGFRGEEYWSAVKVFGRPHFIHRWWDQRARREIGAGDLVVFATGNADQPVKPFNAPDIDESAYGEART